MWPFLVTVIYEEQSYYNIAAENLRKGSKRRIRRFKKCATNKSVKGATFLSAETMSVSKQ